MWKIRERILLNIARICLLTMLILLRPANWKQTNHRTEVEKHLDCHKSSSFRLVVCIESAILFSLGWLAIRNGIAEHRVLRSGIDSPLMYTFFIARCKLAASEDEETAENRPSKAHVPFVEIKAAMRESKSVLLKRWPLVRSMFYKAKLWPHPGLIE